MDIGPPKSPDLAPDRARPAAAPPAPPSPPPPSPRRGRRLRLGLALAVGLAVLLAGGGWLHNLLTTVHVDDARIAADMITLSSRVPGWVAEMRVSSGDPVPRGGLLLRVDGRDAALAQQELEARLAGLATRRAELEARIAMVDAQSASQQAAQRARLEAARAALPAAEGERDFAEAEYARAERLMAATSGTRQRLEQTQALASTARQRVLSAEAEVRNAEAQLQAAEAARQEIAVLRQQLAALGPQEAELRASRDRVALDIADRSIAMPFDGVVDRVFVDPGEYVQAGQRILMIHDPAAVRVEANVKETEIRFFRPGRRVQLSVDAYPGRSFEGVVDSVVSAATSEFALLPSPNPSGNFTKITQRLPVRIRLDPAPQPGLLRPGMMVVVETPAVE